MSLTHKVAIINGTPYLHPVGVNSGKSLGNTTKLTVAANFDEKNLPNMQGGGGNKDTFSRFKDGTVTLECREASIELLLVALGGEAEAVVAGAVANEAHTVVELDTLIKLDHMQDMSATLTVTPAAGGGDAYEEGVDYIRKRPGIIPLSTGSIAAAAQLKFAYTKSKHQRVQALINTVTERGLLFDGVNEREGEPWCAEFHRLSFGPTKSLEFIGDDYLNWTITGNILAWDGITDPAKSPFYELLVGDL